MLSVLSSVLPLTRQTVKKWVIYLPDVDSPEDIMPAPEADSTEESGLGGMTNSDDSSSQQTTP